MPDAVTQAWKTYTRKALVNGRRAMTETALAYLTLEPWLTVEERQGLGQAVMAARFAGDVCAFERECRRIGLRLALGLPGGSRG